MEYLRGADKVIAWFGRWPSFHDAELLELHLHGVGLSSMKIRAFNMTNRVDAQGCFVSEKHAIVTFVFEGLKELKLDENELSVPNTILDFTLEHRNEKFLLTFDTCDGFTVAFEASTVAVNLLPSPEIGHNAVRS